MEKVFEFPNQNLMDVDDIIYTNIADFRVAWSSGPDKGEICQFDTIEDDCLLRDLLKDDKENFIESKLDSLMPTLKVGWTVHFEAADRKYTFEKVTEDSQTVCLYQKMDLPNDTEEPAKNGDALPLAKEPLPDHDIQGGEGLDTNATPTTAKGTG